MQLNEALLQSSNHAPLRLNMCKKGATCADGVPGEYKIECFLLWLREEVELWLLSVPSRRLEDAHTSQPDNQASAEAVQGCNPSSLMIVLFAVISIF